MPVKDEMDANASTNTSANTSPSATNNSNTSATSTNSNTSQYFPLHRPERDVNPKPNFPDLETQTLRYWNTHDTFKKSIENRPAGRNGDNEFVFYDGPPFANGLPHYGHLLTGYVKDLVGRYQTMAGHRVERRFGWDTHGLPAELEAERELGIEDKSEIEGPNGIGIKEFNDACQTSVLKYTKEWQEYVTRQARWVDFDNDYKTLDPSYMESVIWAFKTLYDKGLIYEGYRVLPYCWNDETPLSNHELGMDDVYQERVDQTATVGVRLLDEVGNPTGELALIWTTTPWTLPSNLAIAVGEDIDYVVLQPTNGALADEKIIIAKVLAPSYADELGLDDTQLDEAIQAITVAEYKGSQLVGRRYAPIFPFFANRPASEAPGANAFQIIAGDFVTTDGGTGLVHLAPAFGEDDMLVCRAAGIHAVVPVGADGKFTVEVPDYVGVQVFDSNKLVLANLREHSGPIASLPPKQRPVLVAQKSYAHSYPHCWRCRQPLIYRAMSSWFVEVTKIRDRLVELNQQINWVPSHLKDGQFGNWLAGARDWSISRTRFWGAPIPVWKSDNPAHPRVDVYGSYAELERDFGKVENLHRPYVDQLTRPNPDDPTGKSTMRRVPDVLDCWFESGSMPFAQVHYPFENREWFDNHYPGDFIVEYIGQTRGWFYTLHVLATALFDRPAFRNCLSHGIVLGNDGRKMSKSLRNYPDVFGVFNTYGSDAMRWLLMSSSVIRGGNLIVSENGVRDAVRQILLPLWNTYYFVTLYANACHGGHGLQLHRLDQATEQKRIAALPEMDRYLLARTKQVCDQAKFNFDAYNLPGVAEVLRDHLDVLTNWYVRTQRQRFWDEDQSAFDTLYTALLDFVEASAPLLPLVTEEIWRGLTGGESVHLQDYPVLPTSFQDSELVQQMDQVREIVSAAHSLRKTNKLRVRQPLSNLIVVCEQAAEMNHFADLIASEVNVKHVQMQLPLHSDFRVHPEVSLNPKEFAPEVRKLTSTLFKAQKSGEWHLDGDRLVFPNVQLEGQPVVLEAGQFQASTRVEAEAGQVAQVLTDGTFVVLDTNLTPELENEGYARDLIRLIQDARKNANLHVTDRIHLELTVPSERKQAVHEQLHIIKQETLSSMVTLHTGAELQIQVGKIDHEE